MTDFSSLITAQNGHAPTHMEVPTAVTLGMCVFGIYLACQDWRVEEQLLTYVEDRNMHIGCFRSKTETNRAVYMYRYLYNYLANEPKVTVI